MRLTPKPVPSDMNQNTDQLQRDLEEFKSHMQWDENTTADIKDTVLGNLNGFVSFLRQKRVLAYARSHDFEIDRLSAMLDMLDAECDRAEKAHGELQRASLMIERLRCTIVFFASVIKCGEEWSDECQLAYDKAMETL